LTQDRLVKSEQIVCHIINHSLAKKKNWKGNPPVQPHRPEFSRMCASWQRIEFQM